MKYISFFCQAISFFCLLFFITYYFILCQPYFILFLAQSYIITISFLTMLICLVMMGSIYKTCDLLLASIYMVIAQLIYIMASNINKH